MAILALNLAIQLSTIKYQSIQQFHIHYIISDEFAIYNLPVHLPILAIKVIFVLSLISAISMGATISAISTKSEKLQ